MGCSNPHPHGQVWSLSEVPQLPAAELSSLYKYALNTPLSNSGAPVGFEGRSCMLCEYAHFEVNGVPKSEGRVVILNEHWVALAPWWAVWPYELMGTITISGLDYKPCSYFLQFCLINDIFPHYWTWTTRKRPPWLKSSQRSRSVMTTFSDVRSPIQWGYISVPHRGRRASPIKTTSHTSTSISTRHFCEVLPCASSSSGELQPPNQTSRSVGS